MQGTTTERPATLEMRYPVAPGSFDEMWGNGTGLVPHWKALADRLGDLDGEEVARLVAETNQQIRANGITYNVVGDPKGLHSPWALDPVPLLIGRDDWSRIEAGLVQRAELFDAILADLYGARSLVAKGVLPPEVVYAHRGFLRPCDGLAGRLVFYAADLSRGPDGRMWVINDRTQAPSGSGYALENRIIASRVLPGPFGDSGVRRLAGYFRGMLRTLRELAPYTGREPRMVILTPGPFNETYFEHAYLAAYLGLTLVQSDDLTVRDARVWLKSLQGLEPVDVIVRRVDAEYCDPLELRGDSRLGVPGLLCALRAGHVVVANPLGSGVLENPGLLAFLEGACRHLRDEKLLLPSAATWWCGHQKERDHVLANLPKLLVKGIHRERNLGTVLGPDLSKAGLAALRERILAEPHLYVGQEQVAFSTAPALVNQHLEPRLAVLRCFAAASGDSYALLPGGLTRSASSTGEYIVGGASVSKDTWVVGGEDEPYQTLWDTLPGEKPDAREEGYHLPSRAGENLFWTGRYAERADGIARLLRRVLRTYFESDRAPNQPGGRHLRALLFALTDISGTPPGFHVEGAEGEALLDAPEEEIFALITDESRQGSLASVVRSLLSAAYVVRDLWSGDTWRVIDSIDTHWRGVLRAHSKHHLHGLRAELNQLIVNLSALAGLTAESMIRDTGWYLLDLGRRIERGLQVLGLVRSTLTGVRDDVAGHLVMESVLDVCDSLVLHRRRYRAHPTVASLLELIILDARNPRSLISLVDTAYRHVEALPRKESAPHLTREQRRVFALYSKVRLCEIPGLAGTDETGLRPRLENFLREVAASVFDLSNALTATYFSHSETTQELRG